jgi:hypothetical protein
MAGDYANNFHVTNYIYYNMEDKPPKNLERQGTLKIIQAKEIQSCSLQEK